MFNVYRFPDSDSKIKNQIKVRLFIILFVLYLLIKLGATPFLFNFLFCLSFLDL